MAIPPVPLIADNSEEGERRRLANVDSIHRFFAAMRTKDIDSWIDLWSDSAQILVPYPPQGAGFPDRIEGRNAIEPGFRALFARFTRYHADVHTIYPSQDPDVLIAEWSVEAYLDEGTVYRGDNITVFRFQDEKLYRYHDYFNPELFRAVIEAAASS